MVTEAHVAHIYVFFDGSSTINCLPGCSPVRRLNRSQRPPINCHLFLGFLQSVSHFKPCLCADWQYPYF